MGKKNGRKSSKPIKRLKKNDTLLNNELIWKISLSSHSTLITLNPAKTVKELRDDFEGKENVSQHSKDDQENKAMNTGENDSKANN